VNRSLIIARINPESESDVARIFGDSDATDLPTVVGVRRRSLYRLSDLYVHLLETEQSGAQAVEVARGHGEFARVSDSLRPHISPYLPTWKSPRDAQAHCFYDWTPEGRQA